MHDILIGPPAPGTGRLWWAVLAAIIATLLVAAGFAGLWLARVAPPGQVALPGPEATPAQVVRAYVRAINVRAYSAANAMTGGSY